jgi:preprotein translocase subunit SecG
MSTGQIVLGVLQLICSIFLIVVVLLQQGKGQGLGAISGGDAPASDSYFSKHSGHTKDAFFRRITLWVAIAFAVLTLVLNLLELF